MRQVTFHMQSLSPMAQGAPLQDKKQRDETSDEHEERCWIQRAHINKAGHVFIPPMALKNAISEAAKYKSEQIPGKGKATYTKHFEAGVLVMDPIVLPHTAEDIIKWRHFVPADGRRGGSKRVYKNFPRIDEWDADATVYVVDDIIDQDVFERTLKDAGQFIGVGSFRVRNNGYFGRFAVSALKWSAT